MAFVVRSSVPISTHLAQNIQFGQEFCGLDLISIEISGSFCSHFRGCWIRLWQVVTNTFFIVSVLMQISTEEHDPEKYKVFIFQYSLPTLVKSSLTKILFLNAIQRAYLYSLPSSLEKHTSSLEMCLTKVTFILKQTHWIFVKIEYILSFTAKLKHFATWAPSLLPVKLPLAVHRTITLLLIKHLLWTAS